MSMKDVLGVHPAPRQHWVGDGFPVRSLLSYDGRGAQLSPFLLLDHAGPMRFDPSDRPRGVGEHPHRGFETVTIVYDGEVAHRDSTGAGGTIGPGDVQWMTAAAGVVHDEFHSPAFTRDGGTLEMVQLWVNLPARHKMTTPRYQNIARGDIPVVNLPDAAGTLRVIAGEYDGETGAAATFTPVDVWDVHLTAGSRAQFDYAAGRTLAIAVLDGEVVVNGVPAAGPALVELDPAGQRVTLDATRDAKILILGGDPLGEPVVGHGPFVMNTAAEIREAILDFNSGRFGRIHKPGEVAE